MVGRNNHIFFYINERKSEILFLSRNQKGLWENEGMGK